MSKRTMGTRRWSEAERARFAARDRSLMERFLAGEVTAETELATRLGNMGRKRGMSRFSFPVILRTMRAPAIGPAAR